MFKLDTKMQAVASWTILLAMLLAFYIIIIHPAISARFQFKQRYEELQFQFSKLGNAESKSHQLQMELDRLRAQETDKTGFLENKPDALAAADLQNHIKTLIESSEGNLVSTQVVSQKEVDVFPKVTVKVYLRGSIEALRNVLYQMDSNQPVLIIDNLLIQRRGGSNRRSAQREADQLELRFDVTGFMFESDAS